MSEKYRNSEKVNSTCIKHKFIFVFLILISCVSVYTYIDYLYGIRALDVFTGYTDNGKYNEIYTLQNGECYTKNSERIYYTRKRTDIEYYPKERIATINGTILGKQGAGSSWLRKDLGPTPLGTEISSYEINTTKSYISSYIPYTATRYYRPIFGWKEISETYTDYEPVYTKYKVSRCFSIFDISKELPLFCNEDSIYHHLLDQIVQELQNYGIVPIEGTVKGSKAIIYDTYDGIPMRRIIFCANERMYMLETKSTHNLEGLSNDYCSNLDITAIYKLEEGWYTGVVMPLICILFVYLLIHILKTIVARKVQKANKMAKKLYSYNYISFVISFVALCWFVSKEYDVYPCQYPYIVSLISLSVIFNIMALSWIIKKYGSEYSVDWAITPWLKKHCYTKLKQEKSRRLYLSIVVYPVIVLCATPLCEYAIVYGFLITVIMMIVVYYNKWSEWLNGGTTEDKEDISKRT